PGEIRPMPRDTPPHIDAAIRERALVGIELRPHHRMDAVAGDQHAAVLRRQRSAVPGNETCDDARGALLRSDTSMARDEIFRPEITADPEREDFRRGLEHADAARRLGGVDGQCQRQPANAAADDDELHEPLLGYSRADIAYAAVLRNLANDASGGNIACASGD